MAFDPFGGGGANHGSHVVFAPSSIPAPSNQWDWGRPQIAPPSPSTQPIPAQQPQSIGDAIQQAQAARLAELQNLDMRREQVREAQATMGGAAGIANADAQTFRGIIFDIGQNAMAQARAYEARMAYLEARRQEEETVKATAVNSGAQIATEQLMDSMSSSASLGIAQRLPGSPADGYRYMETLRHDEQMIDERRAVARKMAKKDDEMAYRD